MQHNELMQWVNETARLCQPESIYWCNGSEEEYVTLCDLLVKKGTFMPLNQQKWPDSFACFSHGSSWRWRRSQRIYIGNFDPRSWKWFPAAFIKTIKSII